MRPEDVSALFVNAGVQASYAKTITAFSMMARAWLDSLRSRYEAETGTCMPIRQAIMTTRMVFEEVLVVAPKVASKFGKSYATFFWDFQRQFHQLGDQIQSLEQVAKQHAVAQANLLAA